MTTKVPLRSLSMLIALILIELAVTAILAIGMLLVLLPGHIDLSAGSGVGLTGAVAAVAVFDGRWPAPLALLVSAVMAVVVWGAMGALIVRQKIPAFIITLGGLLVFKGLHWLVIRNQTIPVVEGGKENIYSLLTTYYVPPMVGVALGVAVVAFQVYSSQSARKQRISYGFQVDDGETNFLKLFVGAQL